MSDQSGKPGISLRDAMELEKARLLEQAERDLARVRAIEQKLARLAEYEQLAAEFNYNLVAKSSVAESQPSAAPAKIESAPSHVISRENEKDALKGTIADLVDKYRTNPQSSFQKLRYQTREAYNFSLERIKRERGHVLLSSITKSDLERFYEGWSATGTKMAMGHSMMGKIRTLFTFGAKILENPECQRLSGVYQTLHFEAPKARVERLTAEQANAICAAARKVGWGSIALAQAIQFGTGLRQRDVIGEWVPIAEHGAPSEIINDKGQKWLRGLRWSQIDQNFVLSHVTSFQEKKVEIDLKLQPMIVRELELKYGAFDRSRMPTNGAIIISERNDLPFTMTYFRRQWRRLANSVGIPNTIRNMDSMRSSDGAEDGGSELGADTAL